MNEFKAGDIVEVIKDRDCVGWCLKKNDIYKVSRTKASGHLTLEYLHGGSAFGGFGWLPDNFRLCRRTTKHGGSNSMEASWTFELGHIGMVDFSKVIDELSNIKPVAFIECKSKIGKDTEEFVCIHNSVMTKANILEITEDVNTKLSACGDARYVTGGHIVIKTNSIAERKSILAIVESIRKAPFPKDTKNPVKVSVIIPNLEG